MTKAEEHNGEVFGGEAAPLVLIVDDVEDNRMVYVLSLGLSGFRIAEAENGEEAIRQAQAFLPDVIVMDLSLPVMDGWEATRHLKRDPRTWSIPVIVLTGHILPAHGEAAREAGCDLVVTKPCAPAELREAIRGLLSARSRG